MRRSSEDEVLKSLPSCVKAHQKAIGTYLITLLGGTAGRRRRSLCLALFSLLIEGCAVVEHSRFIVVVLMDRNKLGA